MKKYIIYVGILIVGLLFGWILFGNSSNKETDQNENVTAETNQMWTCSMHPQIMRPGPGDCPICGMDLIPAETGSDGLAANQFKLSKNAMALANVQTTVVESGKAEANTVKLSGKIVANEEVNIVQVSYFSGRIEKLHIRYTGEKVSKGQLLATVYSPELVAAQQELLTAMSLKDSQPTLYKAVRNKLKLWKLSENQISNIESSKKVIENYPLYATVSGTVSEKLVEEGMTVKEGQALFKIADFNTVWANFDVYENQIHLFKKGQKITITSKAVINKKFVSKVSFIDPTLNIKTRVVTLRAVLNNSKNIFKPGMFIEGEIDAIEDGNEVLTIPETAVLWTGKRSVVYIKVNKDEPIFEMVEIMLGSKKGNSYAVLMGLKAGDEIVTNGTFTIDAAAQLQGKKSMMNKSGGKTTTGHEGHLGMNESAVSTSMDSKKKLKRIKVSTVFQKQLLNVVKTYLSLKDDLVKSDARSAQKNALDLLGVIAKVDMKLLKGAAAHTAWMNYQKMILQDGKSISKSDDLVAQRVAFVNLSESVIGAVQTFGVNQKIMAQFCPMANSNKGAYWLSLEATIKNPYYGDAMLSCGEVKEVIE